NANPDPAIRGGTFDFGLARKNEEGRQRMKKLALGILGSGTGSNCRAILDQIRAGKLDAEARLVVADVFDAGILDIAREFEVPNVYLPPGNFRTRLEPKVELELVRLLQDAG